MPKPRFVKFIGKDGKWYFHLKAGNNEIVSASSQGYDTAEEAESGISAVKRATMKVVEEGVATVTEVGLSEAVKGVEEVPKVSDPRKKLKK